MKDHLLKERAASFWKFVSIKTPNECWEWNGSTMQGGYGAFPIRHLKIYSAHRAAYTIVKGPISKGMYVCHSCDNPRCVNPAHLSQGTPKQNSLDSVSKGRWNRPVGEASSNSKLKRNDVVEIRRLFAEGATNQELSEKFKTSENNVWYIVNRKTWTHV